MAGRINLEHNIQEGSRNYHASRFSSTIHGVIGVGPMETGHILMSQLFPHDRIGLRFLEEVRQKMKPVRHCSGEGAPA